MENSTQHFTLEKELNDAAFARILNESKGKDRTIKALGAAIVVLIGIIFVLLAVYSKPNDPQWSGVSHCCEN